VSKSATSSVDEAIRADLIVSGTSAGPGSFSRTLAKAVSTVPGVTSALTVYGGQFEVRRSLETLRAVSTRAFSQMVMLHLSAGSIGTLADGDLLIDSSTARSDHLSVGSTVPVKFALTGPVTVRIGGIYKPNAVVGSYVVSEAFYLSHYRQPLPGGVALKTNGDTVAVEREVERLLAPYPTVQVQTLSQFEQSQVSSVNQLLSLVYALLALAVLVALIGVVNTLMLSVFERTREIGLLRAVGMRRGQVRAMVRSESVILSLFGAAIGIIIGTGMGVALVSSLKLTDTAVPATTLVAFLVISAVLGLVAANWPARRAAKLDVLAAIATE
ncbi:MAG TPA: ABC transporter permease, partial [Acidimicrobiales bacterium]|nr:ABC transporter permease [Acidimicrobiales bacterium]